MPLTVVIKVGTTSICDEATQRPRLSNLALLVETVVELRRLGHRVVLVSSGAIGMGMRRLRLDSRPKHLAQKQALAAVGQGQLMSLYDALFAQVQQPIAQVLLTRHDIADRSRYLNACNTFNELLDYGTVPIVNENDTVSVAEIRFGDNDSLSAITAGMLKADWLFLLTDVDCLYTDNPRTNPQARPVTVVSDLEALMSTVTVSSPGSALGTGGMVTKLVAAQLATARAVNMVITNGQRPDRIPRIIERASSNAQAHDPDLPYTHFLPKQCPMLDRKWWILHGLATRGTVVMDGGAFAALSDPEHNASLFAAGVVAVQGEFGDQQAVQLVVRTAAGDMDIVGKGLVNYTSSEIRRVMGRKSSEIASILGYEDADCVVHRENIVLTQQATVTP